MALNKGHLLLLSLGLVLSLAQLALAHYSWHSEEDDWYNNFKKPKVDGGKKLYKKKYAGFYNGKPSYDDGSDEVDTYPKRLYKKPYKLSPFNKPYYKYKPSSYNPKPVYKPKPTYTKSKPSYTKPKYIKPDAEPTYTKPKPIYTKPATEPTYTEPADTEPTYTSPDTEPIYNPEPSPYKKPLPLVKKPYSYYRKPVPDYVPPQQPEPTYPETPAPELPTYTRPASSSEQEWLEPHNAARAEVGLPPMVWSDEVAQFAQSWANQRLASGCGLEHSGGPYGENIFWGSGGGYGPAECVAAWVNEKKYYNYADNSCSNGDCGHYTQIIWANSVRLGCAKVQCDSGNVFMTCNYDPPGNYIGTKPY